MRDALWTPDKERVSASEMTKYMDYVERVYRLGSAALQHASASTTQRYIGIEPQRIEEAIQGHAQLI